MDYEAFKAAWTEALRESGLSAMGLDPTERVDTRTLDRTFEVHLEPLGGQDAPPFHVTATLGWRWDALNSARGTLREEDLLAEVFGRDGVADRATARRCLNIDIKLSARAPYDEALPMPSAGAWQKWAHETGRRLDEIEPLLPLETLREDQLGMTEVLAWQRAPRVIAVCTGAGDLRLEGVEISAGVVIELPRLLDFPEEADPGPEEQLTELFERLRASLAAWMQAVDHLRPGKRASG